MTFLNVILLGGMVAGAIPVIIHFINRSRFRVEPWGAMHLLEEIIRVRRRRLQLEQLILLLVRIGIPLLLAFCMARPVLTGMQRLLGAAKSSVVVLLDNSFSMNASEGTQSHLMQAREEAVKIVDGLPRGSEVTLLWLADDESTRQGPTFDQKRIIGALSGLDYGYGAAGVAAGLESAAGLVAKSHYGDRELVILSDFQRVSWSAEPTAATVRRQLAEQIRGQSVPPHLSLIRVGEEVRENVAVEALDLSRQILGINQKLRVRATVRNYGEESYAEMRVYFRVDNQDRAVSQITLGPRQRGQVLFSHQFDTAGSHVIEVYADADPLKADNVKRVSLPVWDTLPVLLVSGEVRREPLASETAFLEIALQPYAAAKAELADLIRLKVIETKAFTAETLNQREVKVLVLANVRQLSEEQVKAAADFVGAGGGLLIFPGDRVNAAWYNSKFNEAGKPLLPCPLGEKQEIDPEKGQSAAIVVQHYDHPALALFNDPRNGNLGSSRIRQWYPLNEAETGADEKPVVAARLDTNATFLAEKAFGQGRVILCCTACDADWSNLPMRPFYLPLMQQLVTYLASKVYPPRNLEVGQPLAALLAGDMAEKMVYLTDPAGKKIELTVRKQGRRGLVEYGQTQRPGMYVLELPGEELIHYVVNTPGVESDLSLLSSEEYTQVAQEMGAEAVDTAEDYLERNRQRRFGREIWPMILAGVLALLFLELLLEQWFARAK